MIPRVSTLLRLQRVPVPHTNEAVYAVTEDGRRWVAKREGDMGAQALVAEALTWLLANRVGAPVPDAAFCEEERTWLSGFIPDLKHWSPALAEQVSNASEAGATLALDVWVLNEARHAGNLVAQGLDAGGVRLWAIDADEALVGHVRDYEARLTELPRVHNHARGLPIASLTLGALETADRIASVTKAELDIAVEEACLIGGEPLAAALADAVARRASMAPALVRDYLSRLQGPQ